MARLFPTFVAAAIFALVSQTGACAPDEPKSALDDADTDADIAIMATNTSDHCTVSDADVRNLEKELKKVAGILRNSLASETIPEPGIRTKVSHPFKEPINVSVSFGSDGGLIKYGWLIDIVDGCYFSADDAKDKGILKDAQRDLELTYSHDSSSNSVKVERHYNINTSGN